MKHIFYVHSYITYIIAISVIKKYGISGDDVLLLIGRGFKANDNFNDFQTISLKGENTLLDVPSYGQKNLYRYYYLIIQLDKRISVFLKNHKYIAYLPSTRNYLMQLLATHKKCISVNILEEGLLTYTGNFLKQHNHFYSSSLRGRTIKFAKYFFHLNRTIVFNKPEYNNITTVYMVSNPLKSFDPKINVEIISDVIFPPINNSYILNGDSIFFMDRIVENRITSLEKFFETFSLFLDKWIGHNKDLWIKFHPVQRITSDVIEFLNHKDVDYHVIPDDIPAEGILYKSRDLDVYGFHSSLLFYASIWGQRTWSLIDILGQIDPKTQSSYKRILIPEVFFTTVKQLTTKQVTSI